MSVTAENLSTNNPRPMQKTRGNELDQNIKKARPRKKNKKRRKINKEVSQEEIERKRKLANIVHKKVTVSTNWKNFIEQKLHLGNESGSDDIKKNIYKGTFRKNRKNLVSGGNTSKTHTGTGQAETSSVHIEHELPIDRCETTSDRAGRPRPMPSSVKPMTRPRPTIPGPTKIATGKSAMPKLTAKTSEDTTDFRKKITKYIGIDCEMVGVDDDRGKDNMLARVSLVNKFGECIYDKFVQPKEDILDYRTHVSGVRPIDLENAECFEIVQKEVAEIIKGKVIVGHSIHNDLKVLYLNHPRKHIRDTAKYDKFRQLNNGRTPSLKKLTALILGVTIQDGEHNPIIDAKAAMQLYMMYQKEWEAELRTRKGKKSKLKHRPKYLPNRQ